MAYTKTIIYNMALRNLAITASILDADITAGTDTKVVTLDTYYATALEQTLKDADWNFADTYFDLEDEAESEVPGYAYEYSCPDDCVMPRKIVTGIMSDNPLFKVSNNSVSSAKVINTNIQNPKLKYTRLLEDEDLFDADFAMALSWYLSFLVAPSLGMISEQRNALSVYGIMLSGAMTSNGNEDNDIEEQESSMLIARN